MVLQGSTGSAFDFANVRSAITSGQVTSRGGLLRILPPTFKTNFVLMESSGSTVTPSSPEEPRLISFDPTSQLIVTMGGHAGLDDNIVELVEGGPVPRPKVIIFSGERAQIIEDPLAYFRNVRGRDCTGCHGPQFRYLWKGHYPDWAGAFGRRHQPGGGIPGGVDADIARLRAFEQNTIDHPIYGQLDRQKLDYESRSHANLEFNMLLRKIGDERAHLELTTAPNFVRYLPLLFWISMHPYWFNDNFKSEIQEIFADRKIYDLLPQEDRDDFRENIGILIDSEWRTIQDGLSSLGPRAFHAGQLTLFLVVRYVANKLNVDMTNWFLNPQRNNVVEWDGYNRPLDKLYFYSEMDKYFGPDWRLGFEQRSLYRGKDAIAHAAASQLRAASSFFACTTLFR